MFLDYDVLAIYCPKLVCHISSQLLWPAHQLVDSASPFLTSSHSFVCSSANSDLVSSQPIPTSRIFFSFLLCGLRRGLHPRKPRYCRLLQIYDLCPNVLEFMLYLHVWSMITFHLTTSILDLFSLIPSSLPVFYVISLSCLVFLIWLARLVSFDCFHLVVLHSIFTSLS